MTKLVLPSFLLLAVVGCTNATEEPVGSTASAMTEETVSTLAVFAQVSNTFVQAAADAEAERQLREMDMPVPLDGTGCTRLDWSILDPLRVTIHFEGCTTPAGEPVNGAVSGWLNYDGVDGAVGIALDDLTVGPQRLGGFLVVATAGPEAWTVDANVSLEDPSGTLGLEVAVRFSNAGGIPQVDGSGAFTDDADAWTADAAAVRWENPAVCHPTSGELDLTVPGLPPTHVTLGPTDMQIQVGALPAFTQPYPACPSEP